MAELANSSQSLAVIRLSRVMAMAGWEISYVDIDLTRPKAQTEIKVMRDDGRWLWAKVDAHGRCTVERFQRGVSLGMHDDTKGRRPLSPRVNDSFFGRQSYSNPRAMLRNLTAYLADNALRPVALADMRASWEAVMVVPLRLEAPAAASLPTTHPQPLRDAEGGSHA
jgi:hypothetical protein